MADRIAQRLRYLEYLEAQRLRFNFPVEIAQFAERVSKGVRNSTPPVDIWDRMARTARIVELAREEFGPTTLTSAYRDRLYNLAESGVTDSRHVHNDALDFRCRTGTPDQWARFLRGLREAGRFRGGVGVYRSWVHVDTRGSNADWTV